MLTHLKSGSRNKWLTIEIIQSQPYAPLSVSRSYRCQPTRQRCRCTLSNRMQWYWVLRAFTIGTQVLPWMNVIATMPANAKEAQLVVLPWMNVTATMPANTKEAQLVYLAAELYYGGRKLLQIVICTFVLCLITTWCGVNWHTTRVGQDRIYTLYITVYLMISVPKIPYSGQPYT